MRQPGQYNQRHHERGFPEPLQKLAEQAKCVQREGKYSTVAEMLSYAILDMWACWIPAPLWGFSMYVCMYVFINMYMNIYLLQQPPTAQM